MRYFLAPLAATLFALPALADDITAQLNATSATIYPQGASVTYMADMDLPAGHHRVLLPYQNQGGGFTPPRLKVSEGVSIGAINFLQNAAYDQDALLTGEQISAKAAVKAAEDAVKAKQAEINSVQRGLAALDMQSRFLGSVSGSELENPSPEQVRAMSQMILSESQGAITKRLQIQNQLDNLQEELTDLTDAQTKANRAFMRLSPPTGQGDMLAISVEVPAAVSATFKVDRIISQASWSVAYDFRLSYGKDAKMQVERKVAIYQGTGQTWPEIDLVLSTASPFSQSAPSVLGYNRAVINKPDLRPRDELDVLPLQTMSMNRAAYSEEAELVATAPVTAGLVVNGLSLKYEYPRKVTLSSGEQVQLSLDAFSLPVETSLRAVPRLDETAFVMAKVTNNRTDPLLPGQASFYRDGEFIGRGNINMIAAGAEAEMSFGAMESIRLTYKVLRIETGDTGIITSSNTRKDIIEFSVENLTGEAQKIRTLYALPYSQQEDLEISNRIQPNPSEVDVEDMRSLTAWNMEIGAGKTEKVRITTTLEWPKEQLLTWNQ